MPMPNAPSPRALIAGLPPAVNARGAKQKDTMGIGAIAGSVPYRSVTAFARKKKIATVAFRF